jgi:DNA-binding transcriptional LysR family regulator
MNDYYLKVLNLLIREPNLSHAAEKLGTSQSNLSKILRRIEMDWGIKLFDRKGFRGLQPTPEAFELGQIGEQLSREWLVNLNLVKSKSLGRPDLRVIGPPIWCQNYFLPFWYQSAWADKLRLVMTIAPLGEVNLQTVGANYDVIISNTAAYLEDFFARTLFTEKIVLTFNRKNAPARLENIDFNSFKWLAYRVDEGPMQRFLTGAGQGIDIIHSYVNDLRIMVELIKLDPACVACIPDHLASREKENLKSFAIPNSGAGKIMVLCKSKETLLKELTEDLAEFAQGNLV